MNILITGASSGLGWACAIACANAGASLILSGRNIERLNKLQKLLKGENHIVAAADLTLEEDLKRLVDECPKLHGIIHSAGIQGVAPIRLIQKSFIQSVFDTNFFSPILLTQRLLLKRRFKSEASILFISSIAAKAGKVGVGAYSGSKAAIIGTMKPLALEVAKHGIRVNALCPGIVDTPIFQNVGIDDAVKASYPLGLGMPDDIGYASVFFLSEASKYITGTAFSIDGGVPMV
ncbi:SDR family oxidoreductase [Rhizobiales bacterium TNE-4]|nr:SDR family oxidoreductase [Rhizobiales bacterium TNE-4]MBV1828596.1 SDR family oxidoreductase [Rhizobiales bacterium TNE-4]